VTAFRVDLHRQTLVPGLGVMHHESCHAVLAADGIVAATRDQNRQVSRYSVQLMVGTDLEQRAHHIDPQPAGVGSAA
jgi:hypothetical protein